MSLTAPGKCYHKSTGENDVGGADSSLLIGQGKTTPTPKQKTNMNTMVLTSLNADVWFGVNNVRLNNNEKTKREISLIIRLERQR